MNSKLDKKKLCEYDSSAVVITWLLKFKIEIRGKSRRWKYISLFQNGTAIQCVTIRIVWERGIKI